MKTIYYAKDKTPFETESACREYENAKFDEWVTSPSVKVKLSDLFEVFGESSKTEFYGSEQDLLTHLLRQYWEATPDV